MARGSGMRARPRGGLQVSATADRRSPAPGSDRDRRGPRGCGLRPRRPFGDARDRLGRRCRGICMAGASHAGAQRRGGACGARSRGSHRDDAGSGTDRCACGRARRGAVIDPAAGVNLGAGRHMPGLGPAGRRRARNVANGPGRLGAGRDRLPHRCCPRWSGACVRVVRGGACAVASRGRKQRSGRALRHVRLSRSRRRAHARRRGAAVGTGDRRERCGCGQRGRGRDRARDRLRRASSMGQRASSGWPAWRLRRYVSVFGFGRDRDRISARGRSGRGNGSRSHGASAGSGAAEHAVERGRPGGADRWAAPQAGDRPQHCAWMADDDGRQGVSVRPLDAHLDLPRDLVPRARAAVSRPGRTPTSDCDRLRSRTCAGCIRASASAADYRLASRCAPRPSSP